LAGVKVLGLVFWLADLELLGLLFEAQRDISFDWLYMVSPQGQHRDKSISHAMKVRAILVGQVQHSLEPLYGVQRNLILLEGTSVW
jgi:hypothetical protein